MQPVLVVISVLCALFGDVSPRPYNLTCGLDNSNASMLYEGLASIETYPWMGTLFYENDEIMKTTSVVLITKQMVLASAYDIDRLPKEDIRKRSRVVLGRDCEGPNIRIRDYTFHPDYIRNTYSALAMIQLETDQNEEDLMPICPPPAFFVDPQFYAMTTSKDCTEGNIHIREMVYVNKDQCRQFYRKSGVSLFGSCLSGCQGKIRLDAGMFWPSHTACARAVSGGKCMWRSGTALAVKQDGHWRLLGFGVHGPGCGAPARFLDYGMQEPWVRKSIARIGMPAITRLANNHLVLRRSLSSVQRFGPCDPEESKVEMYTDLVYIKSNREKEGRTYYNVTLIHSVEYSCVVFRAEPLGVDSYESGEKIDPIPKLYLRRWCAGPPQVCYGFHLLEVQFSVEIKFAMKTTFYVAAYGKEAKIMDPALASSYGNKIRKRPHLPKYEEVKIDIRLYTDIGYRWFYRHHLIYNKQPRNDGDFVEYNKPESEHW